MIDQRPSSSSSSSTSKISHLANDNSRISSRQRPRSTCSVSSSCVIRSRETVPGWMRHYRATSITRLVDSQHLTPMRRLCAICRYVRLSSCLKPTIKRSKTRSQVSLWSLTLILTVEPTFVQLLIKNGYVVEDQTQQSGNQRKRPWHVKN